MHQKCLNTWVHADTKKLVAIEGNQIMILKIDKEEKAK